MNVMSTTTTEFKPVGAPPLEKQTTVGNYFVSNYPPYSFWKPDFVPQFLSALERAPSDFGLRTSDLPLGLYVHIPFCRKRCHFCYFKVYTDRNAQEVGEYLDVLAREWELYAALPSLAGRPLDFVYFGGGTPSFLSTTQLDGLVRRLTAVSPWTTAEEINFEGEPGTLTEAKLSAIRGMGA